MGVVFSFSPAIPYGWSGLQTFAGPSQALPGAIQYPTTAGFTAKPAVIIVNNQNENASGVGTELTFVDATGQVRWMVGLTQNILVNNSGFALQFNAFTDDLVSTQPVFQINRKSNAGAARSQYTCVFSNSIQVGNGIYLGSFGQSSDGFLDTYRELVWTPTFSNLIIVNGTGAATITGHYQRVGNLVKWTAEISVTGTCTTQSGAGNNINNLPLAAGVMDVANISDAAAAMSGHGFVLGTTITLPVWAANNNNICISGIFYV
jgi:hypothetical protein